MNYLEYRKIVEVEELEESAAVKLFLSEASKLHKFWKRLENRPMIINFGGLSPETHYKKLVDMEIKDRLVDIALDVARAEKANGWKFIEDREYAIESIPIVAETVGFDNPYLQATLNTIETINAIHTELNNNLLKGV